MSAGGQAARAGCALALLAALPLAAAAGAWPDAPAREEPIWLDPAPDPAAGGPAPACDHTYLIAFPETWVVGDAAVLLVRQEDGPPRERLRHALLRQDAAVMELDATAACARAAAPGAEDRLAEILGALRALRTDAGAGAIVLIAPAEAPWFAAAADPAEAARRLGEADHGPPPRFAAAIGLAPEAMPVILPGPPLPEAERWDRRAPLLCAALAGAGWGDGAALRHCAARLAGAPP